MNNSNAIIVCVDYWDYLRITLPHNRHHFNHILVVTSPNDIKTKELCEKHGVAYLSTDAFYKQGALFNKWLALEEGLDVLGRQGWISILDADVILPETIYAPPLEIGNLYGPKRRMGTHPLPENKWGEVPLWELAEFSGFMQVFHGSDPHLPAPPWHQTDWLHAGGADTFFQELWPESNRIRLPFEVLHIGPNGKNWCGRVTPIDGEVPKEAARRRQQLRQFMDVRRRTPRDQRTYSNEKINDRKD